MLTKVKFSELVSNGHLLFTSVGSSSKGLFLISTAMLFSLFFVADAIAASQLMITPTRIVFSGKMRSASATIINTGDSPGTYRISLVNKRMSVDGAFEDVKEAKPGELFSDKMIRYSPRQVILQPGESQVIRLGLRKPSDLKDGEYRSHMLFSAIPIDAGKNVEQSVKSPSGLNIKLTAIVGISIPIIVRHGHTEAEVSIVSASIQPRQANEDNPYLLMELERNGNRSVYGDFLAEFVSKDGVRSVVAQVGGVAIYTPGTKRRVRLPIKAPPGLEMVHGTLQVFYRSPASQGGKILAQKQIMIP